MQEDRQQAGSCRAAACFALGLHCLLLCFLRCLLACQDMSGLLPVSSHARCRRKKDHGRAEALLLAAWALGVRMQPIVVPVGGGSSSSEGEEEEGDLEAALAAEEAEELL